MAIQSDVKNRFLRSIQKHELTMIQDRGGYRHLRFKKPGTNVEYFDLITWPGHLCFTGDMGTYVFSRVRDMFEFFRDSELRINAPYWSEKVLARDRDGIQEWSPRTFREMAIEQVRAHFEDAPIVQEDALEELHKQVLPYAEEEWEAAQAYMQFGARGFQPESEDLSHCYEYTFRYLWCCFAIVWGIQQYDARLTEAA